MKNEIKKLFEDVIEYPPENEHDQNSNVRKLKNLMRDSKIECRSVTLYDLDYKNIDHEKVAGEILESISKLVDGKLTEFKGTL